MSLRTRLIVAFFALSVVPLGAVTVYTYRTNVEALRDAAEREADLLAGELSQRMQLVTAQLSERVEHLMDIAELQAAADKQASAAPAPATTTAASVVDVVHDRVAKSLGEAAMLLNNIELLGLRGGGPGRGGDGRGTGSRGVRPPPAGATGAAGQANQTGRSGQAGQTAQPPLRQPRGRPSPPPPAPPAAPATPPAPGAAQAPPATAPADSDRLMVDLMPIRREMYRQLMGETRPETLTSEQRQRVAEEINQRMLGIVQGIKLGAAELQKKAEEAAKEAQAEPAPAPAAGASAVASVPQGARGAAASKPAPSAASPATPRDQKKSSLSGNRLDVKVERNGEVVRQVNAELNLPNLLATVFATTRRDRGEVPFAVGDDGRLYTRSDADRATVESLGGVAKTDGPATARLPAWIVVTTPDPSGSGLRLGIARPVGDSLADLRRAAARNLGFGLLFIGVAIIGIVPLSARLTRNLNVLGDAVHRIAQGDYRARVPEMARDEVGRLAVAFNQMAQDVERHQQVVVEQERIKRELELGRRIQNEMLPHAPLRLGLTEIKGVSVPAREVGGDFFNYFEVGGGRVALLVGDVSGKGVGAALLMANIQATLRTRLALGQDLSALAGEVDRDIEAASPGPVYATLFVGILDPASRRLRYVNAGHHPQYILRQGGGLERMASTGLPVGLLAGRGHEERQAQLAAGDLLFFYTDGCVEAESETGDMFGAERLETLLTSAGRDDSSGLLERVEAAIKTFRGRREPFDDATMMAVTVG